jgi:NitT/TauT family transport system substrate-binding protein
MRSIAITAGLALALAASGAVGQTKQPMKLMLNFLAGGPQAGFMYGKKLGFYDQVGIDLTIEEGKGSATTAQQIATGQAEVGFADAPAAMQVRSKGGPVKVIAPILQTTGFAIISLEETGIRAPTDLVGRLVAVQPGTAQTTLLDAIFAANSIDKAKVNIVNIDPAALVGTLLEKKVHAILAGADFQSVQMRDRGFKIHDIFYRDVGVPTVGLSIIARDDKLQANADLYRRFVSASLKGWDAARKNPDAASQAVVEQFAAGNKSQIFKQLQVDLLLVCAKGSKALGLPPDENWKITYDLMTKYLGFPTDKPITDYYTADFVPKDAPACS